ncbi:MAG: NUDIX hydrolase [Parachlamydia sp.]|nr:NUDIX hydrolase [Parachlamydia sp.]
MSLHNEASLGIIFRPDKKSVLLIKRCDVPVWVLPGGGIEPGETPEQAVMREVWEETGLRVALTQKSGEYLPINRLSSPTHVYECAIRDGMLRTGCETSDIAFWPVAQLPDSFFIVHRDWLEDALSDREKPIKGAIARVTYGALARYVLRHPIIFSRFLWTRLQHEVFQRFFR